MGNTNAELLAEVKKNLANLQSLGDEGRVKIHLVGMDLKSRWRKLEPQLQEVENAAHDISATSRAAWTDAVKRLEKLRGSLRQPGAGG